MSDHLAMAQALSNARHGLRMATRLARRAGPGPELLCQFVTSRCDARCRHCFDHHHRSAEAVANDLSPDELCAIGARLPRMYFVILTGGEPFLLPELPAIGEAFARGARPAVLAIPTNGGRPEAILAAVEELLRAMPGGTTLSVNVSIDGVGPLHDEIRGVPGLFERAMRTSTALQERARGDSRLVTGIVTVVSQANHQQLEALERYLLDERGVQSWAPFLLRGAPRDPSLAEPALEAYQALGERLERRARSGRWRDSAGFFGAGVNRAKNAVRRRVITRTVLEGRRVVPCRAGSLTAVVRADGTLLPCELLDAPMGTLRDHDYRLQAAWRSRAAAVVRRQVRAGGCACTHENSLSMSVAYDWRSWPALLGEALAFGVRP